MPSPLHPGPRAQSAAQPSTTQPSPVARAGCCVATVVLVCAVLYLLAAGPIVILLLGLFFAISIPQFILFACDTACHANGPACCISYFICGIAPAFVAVGAACTWLICMALILCAWALLQCPCLKGIVCVDSLIQFINSWYDITMGHVCCGKCRVVDKEAGPGDSRGWANSVAVR